MTPAFGFSVGDFIAAIELCTKVAKALKDSTAAAAEYQQLVLELQGLQNVLVRLAAMEPTESNIQHVNAVRGAALASTIPLQEFLTKLDKFNDSLSPFASKQKSWSLSRAARQTQYAVFMDDEVKKIRAVVWGNVLRINLMLATHASESVSRIEARLETDHRGLADKLQETREDMAKLIEDNGHLKSEVIVSRQNVERAAAQVSDRLAKTDADITSLTLGFSTLSAGMTSISNSVSGIRTLSAQILALLQVIPAELRNLIQSVLRSNARLESVLLKMDQKIGTQPSLKVDSNIRMEDALGRIHHLPYEWFRYWETLEGLLKAKFKDAPGSQKIDSGEFRLVHARRPTVTLDKDSWSSTITPGADIVMLMMITDVVFGQSLCPRQSCSGKVSAGDGTVGILTCPECGLRFIPQYSSTVDTEAEDIAVWQHLEDAKLFGMKEPRIAEVESPTDRTRITAVSGEIEMTDVYPGDNTRGALFPNSGGKIEDDTSSDAMDVDEPIDVHRTAPEQSEPPIYSWLAQTVPPNDPSSVRGWLDTLGTEQGRQREREANELEVFRNVQIMAPSETGRPGPGMSGVEPDEDEKTEPGVRVYYRNILDRYEHIERSFALRLAEANWDRQNRLAAGQLLAVQAEPRNKRRKYSLGSQRSRYTGKSKKRRTNAKEEASDLEDAGDGDDELHRYGPGPNNTYTAPSLLQGTGALFGVGNTEFALSGHGNPHLGPKAETPFLPDMSREYTTRRLGGPVGKNPAEIRTGTKRLSNLPPLPLPITERTFGGTLMLCYICHSELYIGQKSHWRSHVMDDLSPYLCPVASCNIKPATFCRKTALSDHLRKCHDIHERVECPFCRLGDLSRPLRLGDREYIKHVARHMEEVSFAVVSTAHDSWSYDDSNSDFEVPMSANSPGYPSPEYHLDQTMPAHLLIKQALMDAAPIEETDYQMNFWTGTQTAASSASSANSRLRDPWPASYLDSGSPQAAKQNSPYGGAYSGYEASTEKGLCPYPECGRIFKDLKAHMLTHVAERPEKCPIATCEYHVKGFARKYDKTRHTLTHYKGTIVCGFCPGSASAVEKSFHRADVFKRHLTSVHGVEQIFRNNRGTDSKKKQKSLERDTALTTSLPEPGVCSVCQVAFQSPQALYEHLDDCVVGTILENEAVRRDQLEERLPRLDAGT